MLKQCFSRATLLFGRSPNISLRVRHYHYRHRPSTARTLFPSKSYSVASNVSAMSDDLAPVKDRVSHMAKSTTGKSTLSVSVSPTSISALSSDTTEADVTCIYVSKSDCTVAALSQSYPALTDWNAAQTQLSDFRCTAKESAVIYSANSGNRIMLVGLGTPDNCTAQTLRTATHTIIAACKQRHFQRARIILPTTSALTPVDVANIVTRIALLSNHVFAKYLTVKEFQQMRSVTLVSQSPNNQVTAAVARAAQIAECTILARELANERADVCHPEYLEAVAQKIAQTHETIQVEVLQHEQLIEKGLNLITAVGQAARYKARIICLHYRHPSNQSKQPVALIGKGITFDSGGLNLKGTGMMEDMHLDMSGAAAVLSTIKAIALTQLNCNVVGVMAVAENAIDALSYKPHNIIVSARGTVEIGNTDAEGRLALADAITHAQRTYHPHTIIDVATLTGACVVALSEHYAGLFANSDTLAAALTEAGTAVHERVWRMPIGGEYADELKTTYADMRSSAGRSGGASIAASFLQKFIDDNVQYAHIDIAGPAMGSKAREWLCEKGTGFGVQLMTEFIERSQTESNTSK